MARRNDHTREELKVMTLEKVREFLADKPHHDLSLRKIATMIGYVPSTLVNVFGNYNLLLLHVVAEALDDLAEQSKQAVAGSQNEKEALYNLAYCYLDFAHRHRYRWQLIFEHKMNGEQLPEWQSSRIQGMTSMLEGLLTQLAPNKSQDEILTTSRVLWSGVHGITLLSVDDKFFANQSIDGKVLIENLISTHLANW